MAMTRKLMTYALGRPLTFADRGELERIARELRRNGDGLRNLVRLVVTSKLFTEHPLNAPPTPAGQQSLGPSPTVPCRPR